MIAEALQWKYEGTEGITVKNETIVEWPIGLPRPTADQLDTIVIEYLADRTAKRQREERLLEKNVADSLPELRYGQQEVIEAIIKAIYGNRTSLDIIRQRLIDSGVDIPILPRP